MTRRNPFLGRDHCPKCVALAVFYVNHPAGVLMTCMGGHRWIALPDGAEVEQRADSSRRTDRSPREADVIALECEDDRTEKGQRVPCGRPAVGWRYNDEGNLYPVCVGHVRHPMRYLLAGEDTRP